MNFEKTIRESQFILTEGSVIERIRRENSFRLNSYVENADFVYETEGREILARLYREYIDVGRRYDVPMIVFTPTWRANHERISLAGLSDRNVNADCFHFLNEIRESYGEYSHKIFIGGLIGCKGDAYKTDEVLSKEKSFEFHQTQVNALASAGVDFLFAATLPAFSESFGIAKAMAASGKPYIISFVVRPEGTLLDGTYLYDAITQIDSSVSPKPIGFMVNCVHPSVFEQAMTHKRNSYDYVRKRIVGLQANTSKKRPEELDGSAELETEEPDSLAASMIHLHKKYGIKILGGCCGTNQLHIQAITEGLESYLKSR